MREERKFIETPNGDEIAAVIHHPENSPKGLTLLQHGLYSDKEGSWETRAKYLANEGFIAVRFDRRGYGESDRKFHEFNLSTGIEDTLTLVDFFETEGEDKFGILGSSFGGLIAIHAVAVDSRINALVLRAPVTYTQSVFAELREEVTKKGKMDLEEMPGEHIDKIFFEDLDNYHAEDASGKIKAPTLIFHGTDDEVVPIKDSKKFYRSLDVEKNLIEAEGEGHVFSGEGGREVLEKSAHWFSKYLDQ